MRVLFLESDKYLRDFLGSRLKSEFRGIVDIAKTVKEAKKFLKTEKPYSVIVSDCDTSKGLSDDLLRFKVRNDIAGVLVFYFGSMNAVQVIGNQKILLVQGLDFNFLFRVIRDQVAP